MPQVTLQTPIRYLPYIGPSYAKRLEKLEILTVEDLFFHLPFRYDDFSLRSNIKDIQAGETISLAAVVESIKNFYTKNGKKLTQAVISDESGKMNIVWFNQHYLGKIIQPNLKYIFSGKADFFGSKITLVSPQYELWQKSEHVHTGRLVPVYPETSGVSSKWLRSRISSLLKCHMDLIVDILPEEFVKEFGFFELKNALSEVHFPDSIQVAEEARRRLAFDELFFIQLRSTFRKKTWQSETAGHIFKISEFKDRIVNFTNNLGFELTSSQKKGGQ